MITPRSMHKQ